MTIELHTPEDDERPVYIAGNFNNWTAHEERFKMLKVGIGHYKLEFPVGVKFKKKTLFKFNRGGWDFVELNAIGEEAKNRSLSDKKGHFIFSVPRWKGIHPPHQEPFIQRIVQYFYLPTLKKKRRITVLLPNDYYRSSRHYPVMYMMDGQNLFDPHGPFGNWAVDKAMAQLARKGMGNFIIVAVDHGKSNRINEFLPFPSRTRKAQGMGFVKDLTEKIKPHIDRNFRTLPDRNHTGIGGSSMGGLFSLFAGFHRPDVFGNVMSFSPSLWIAPAFMEAIRHYSIRLDTRIYLYAGGKEGAGMAHHFREVSGLLSSKSNALGIQNIFAFSPNGRHTEAAWKKEFPKAMEFLMDSR